MVLLRSEISQDDAWDLKPLYTNKEAWENDFNVVRGEDKAPYWPKLESFKGNLDKGCEKLIEALDTLFTLSRKLEKLYIYAHLKHDEDIADTDNKVAYERVVILLQRLAEEASWFEPEILAMPESTLQSYLNNPSFQKYRFHLEKLLRLKEHVLSSREEELLALAGRALQTPHKTFSCINNADFKFPNVVDSQGNSLELTHGRYQIYLQSRDRILRENTLKTLHGKFSEFENTLAELISGQALTHTFNAKARHYDSALQAALKPKNIPINVYKALIKAVRHEISANHAYISLRKKVMGLDPLHLYDMNVPLTKEIDIQFEYKEAETLVIDSVAPLGKEYQEILRKGLQEERWVDRFENKNKRTGAYSSGCFDSHPYVLMNYKNIVRDVFTLAHECGHSMHSYLSRKNQPYHYSDYPIFVAEVASTFNEELLFQLLLNRTTDKEEKIFYINSKIDDIRATLFRQTMFAEFELLIHELVEKDVPLTPALLKEEYRKLVQFYFGSDIVVDEAIDIEWARIPHFYYNFYVYQYATGISAALALADKVLKGGEKEREAYLSFLKGGCSKYPIDLLKDAGVNMEEEAPVIAAIARFRTLVKQLEELLT